MSAEQIWIRRAWDPMGTGIPATFRRIPAEGDTVTLTRPELEGLLRQADYTLAVEACGRGVCGKNDGHEGECDT